MEKRAIERVLVACRGEPGASVARRVEAMGLEAVALYADVDAEDGWLDDVAYAARIGAEVGADPYADGLRIVSAALDAGSDAVHPGIGPLATNAEMAHMVANVGLAWIGSTPASLAACADRAEVRRLVREAGLPVVASSPPLDTPGDAAAWVTRLGMPLRFAPAGRGGRAVFVDAVEQVPAALEAVHPDRTGRAYVVERAVAPARRVIVAVVGDGLGRAIWLGDHEGSLTLDGRVRVRECPAPGVDAALRERLAHAAIQVCGGLRLYGVGAVAFLVGADGRWWMHDYVPALFEGYALHERVYGLELVQAQVRLAAGETLGWTQDSIAADGVAIEVTLCATGPGTLDELRLPEEASTQRAAGANIDPRHDPVLARVQVMGPLRHAVMVRARAVLEHVGIGGVPHDTDVLLALLADPRAWEGHTDTGLLEDVAAGCRALGGGDGA